MPKISQLPAGITPTGTEKIPAVQNGSTVELSAQQVANLAVDVTANQARHGTFWNTTYINRFNDRVFVGPATLNAGTLAFPFPADDWLAALSSSYKSYNGGSGVDQNGSYAQMYVLNDTDAGPGLLAAPTVAAVFGSQTLNSLTGATSYPIGTVAVNNATHTGVGAWGLYVEAHRVSANAGATQGVEIEIRNSTNYSGLWTPYAKPGEGVLGMSIGAGAGLSATGQYDATAAVFIAANPKGFATGILFDDTSISASGPSSSHPAIVMPYSYAIQWYSGAGLRNSIYSDASGNFHFDAVGAIEFSGNTTIPDLSVYGWGDFSTYVGGDSATDFINFVTASVERARINSTGLTLPGAHRLGIGTSAPDAPLTINKNAVTTPPTLVGNPAIHAVGVDAASNDILLDSFGGSPVFNGRRAEGTLALPTATAAGSTLFQLSGFGHDGSSFTALTKVAVVLAADELFSGSAQGTRIAFLTTKNTTTTRTEAMRINNSGGVGIGTTVDPGTGALLAIASIKSNGATSGVGYATGAGGTVTQATSKATGATLNTICGQITMNGAALAASTSVRFVFSNSNIAATDTIVVNIGSGGTTLAYLTQVETVAAGSCNIVLRNVSAGSLSEAVVLNFAVIKGVAA